MRIYLHELSEEPHYLSFTEKETWVKQAIENTQESKLNTESSFFVDFDLRKNQDIVFLKGSLDVYVGLLCSRCANSFDYHLRSNFSNLFTKNKTLVTSSKSLLRDKSDKSINNGDEESESASTSRASESEESYEQAYDDEAYVDIEYLEKEYIELEDVLREQIYLRLPYQPLCKDDCKGLCAVCGQDQNTQPCQCHRIKNPALANGLKNYKIT